MKAFAERLRKASIGLKLSLTFVFVIALCSLPMSLLTINYLSNKLKQHVMNTIEESVQSQKDEFIELILMENYWRAFNKIEALSQIPGVKEVVLVDANNRIIASSKPEEKTVGRSFSSNPDYLKIPIESYSYTIGYLYYQINREYIEGIVSPLRFITLAFTFFFTLVGVLLGVFVSLRINERLRQVREMIEEFKRGGMPTKKDFWERDELTELADFVHKSLSDLKGIFSNLEFARNFYESLFNTLQEIVLILDEDGNHILLQQGGGELWLFGGEPAWKKGGSAFGRTEGKKRGKGEPKAEGNLHGCGKAQKQEGGGELRLGGLGALGGCFYLYLKGYNGAKKV
jgi:PAS domain-containing protein